MIDDNERTLRTRASLAELKADSELIAFFHSTICAKAFPALASLASAPTTKNTIEVLQ